MLKSSRHISISYSCNENLVKTIYLFDFLILFLCYFVIFCFPVLYVAPQSFLHSQVVSVQTSRSHSHYWLVKWFLRLSDKDNISSIPDITAFASFNLNSSIVTIKINVHYQFSINPEQMQRHNAALLNSFPDVKPLCCSFCCCNCCFLLTLKLG